MDSTRLLTILPDWIRWLRAHFEGSIHLYLRRIAMAMKLTPLHDRILVRRVEEQETTRGS